MPTLTRGTKGASRFAGNMSVRNQAYALVENIFYSRDNFSKYRRDRYANYLLMNNNNKTVLGFAFLEKPKYNAARVALLGTVPGKGYGKQIMNRIYKNAKAEGYKKVIVLNAVRKAQPFYQKIGYKPRPTTSQNTHGRLFNKSVSTMTALKRKRSASPQKSASPISKKRKTPSPTSPSHPQKGSPRSRSTS